MLYYLPSVFLTTFVISSNIHTCILPPGPGVLDYGVIAVGSVMEKTLTVKNNLNQYISIIFKVNNMLT